MSADATATAAAAAAPVHAEDGHDDHAHGLSDKNYIYIALGLAVITAIEVAWSYLPVWEDASGVTSFVEVAGLLIMMMIKFVIVASNFMHLKFDNKILTRIFYAGLVLAFGVYIAALATFQVFFHNGPKGYAP